MDGIAVDVHEKLLESVKDVPFSILIDESNKQYGKKFLVILIKFYDQRYEDVTTRFLDICVCNKGIADVLVNVIVEFFNKHDLSFENLIQIMSINIGGCSLHHVHNAIKNSLPELHNYEELEDFLQDASAFFSFHVEFTQKYSEIQDIFDLEQHKI